MWGEIFNENKKFITLQRRLQFNLYVIKWRELSQKYCKNKWWQSIIRNESIRKFFVYKPKIHWKMPTRIIELLTRLFELLVKIQILKTNDMYLKSEHFTQASELWNSTRILCDEWSCQNIFALDNSNNSITKQISMGNQLTSKEHLLMHLEREILEEQQIDLEKIEASLELFPQSEHQLKAILRHQLQNDKIDLELKQREFCQQWKRWMMYHIQFDVRQISPAYDLIQYQYIDSWY